MPGIALGLAEIAVPKAIAMQITAELDMLGPS
jgi:hypothetical protein